MTILLYWFHSSIPFVLLDLQFGIIPASAIGTHFFYSASMAISWLATAAGATKAAAAIWSDLDIGGYVRVEEDVILVLFLGFTLTLQSELSLVDKHHYDQLKAELDSIDAQYQQRFVELVKMKEDAIQSAKKKLVGPVCSILHSQICSL
ncbi:hypothetical protein ACLB2K_006122 [Fragaria x ananassa]